MTIQDSLKRYSAPTPFLVLRNTSYYIRSTL
nr:MAG TPA: hypothetical protein [Caudoviricetes sp.]